MFVSSADIYFMRLALGLARMYLGRSSPNPAVGAIVVKDGQVVGQGNHALIGMPHAEVQALTEAKGLACGASIYVTLEPCNHQGRTPPCTQSILVAGITRVVYGITDPNLRAMGGGDFLASKGLIVVRGVLRNACADEHRFYLTHVMKKRPYVILKTAATLDGKTATAAGDSKWITGKMARQEGHRWRNWCDAICVGIGTILVDNPRLTCRVRGACDPLKIIIDTTLRLPLSAKVLIRTVNKFSSIHCIVVCGSEASDKRRIILEKAGAEVLILPKSSGGVNLTALITKLGQKGITSLLLEGGANLAWGFIHAGLVNEVLYFFAPKLLGGIEAFPMIGGVGFNKMIEAIKLKSIKTQRYGSDLLLRGRFF